MAQVRTDLTDAATVGGFKLAAALARGLPGFAAQGIAPALGLGASFANAERRSMVERHLRRADPTMGGARLRRATQLAFDSYTRYWLESFRLPHLTRRAVDRGMTVEGYEHVEAAVAASKLPNSRVANRANDGETTRGVRWWVMAAPSIRPSTSSSVPT